MFLLQDDAAHQLKFVEKEIQDSLDELERTSPLYEKQVLREKKKTKEYNLCTYFLVVCSLAVILIFAAKCPLSGVVEL